MSTTRDGGVRELVAELDAIAVALSALQERWRLFQSRACAHDCWGADEGRERQVPWSEFRIFRSTGRTYIEPLGLPAITRARRRLQLAAMAYVKRGLSTVPLAPDDERLRNCGRIVESFLAHDCAPPPGWPDSICRMPSQLRLWWLWEGLDPREHGGGLDRLHLSAHLASVPVPSSDDALWPEERSQYVLVQLQPDDLLRYQVSVADLSVWAERQGLVPLTVGEVYQAALWLKRRATKYWIVYAPLKCGRLLYAEARVCGAFGGSPRRVGEVEAAKRGWLLNGNEWFLYRRV